MTQTEVANRLDYIDDMEQMEAVRIEKKEVFIGKLDKVILVLLGLVIVAMVWR